MLMLKLKRIGKKHQVAFRLIVDEKHHKMFGRNVEDLGWYNPRTDKFELKKERVEYWMKVGAKPTDTVHNLLINAGILTGKKIAVHSKPKKSMAPVATVVPVAEAKPVDSASVATPAKEAAPKAEEAAKPAA
jgi:small subunit ribosomal protein S16